MRKFMAFTAAAICFGVMCGSALAAQQIHKSLTLPAEFIATITAAGCNDVPGPQITLQTQQLNLPGLTADVIFSNMIGSQTPQDKVHVSRVVFPENQQVSVPAQSVVGALAQDPFMWLQLTDASGKPLTSEMFLGRCSQGQFSASAVFDLPVLADGDVTATDCTSASGPAVSLEGQATLQPV
ncbi:MAG TPA: hypothetical protein VE404_02085, partial [Verrucomicrobiae bacterium]|nr:hypothetical protein [Verrucomicrobiae bacterium]